MSDETSRSDRYKIGWICPLEVEQIAAMEMLDEEHEPIPQLATDHNVYNLGSINGHNVVIAGLHQTGNCPAAVVVTQMRTTFRNLECCLLVGIGGGVPIETDEGQIRLGHVVVSKPTGEHSGAVQYDHGKARENLFERTGALQPPPRVLLHAAQALAVQRARLAHDPISRNVQRIRTHFRGLRRYKFPGPDGDHLYQREHKHQKEGKSCEDGGCDPEQRIKRSADEGDETYIVVHRGTIASGELVIKDAKRRDSLAQQYRVLCFETEAAGALADLPCMVIRGISDYCDSHKNDSWHGYAAAAAAAYARQLFFHLPMNAPLTADRGLEGQVPCDANYIVPYPENPHFVGRSELLERIKKLFGHSQSTGGPFHTRVSLFGLGGIGKTQVALAYMYWLQHEDPTISVLWVHASNAERFFQSYTAIAETYQIPGYKDPEANVLALVKAWLEKKRHGQWLMVIDNADDLQLFFPAESEAASSSNESKQGVNLAEHLPDCAHGALLITTRNKQLGVRLSKGQGSIEVPRMNNAESANLLRAKSVDTTSTELDVLSARLEHLPLALSQAAAFVHETSITVSKYTRLLGENDEGVIHLLSKEFQTVGRDSQAPHAVAQTLILSVQQIEQQNPLACFLLSIMSVMDRQDIPAQLLSHFMFSTPGASLSAVSAELKFTEALGVLKAFSFVTEDNNGNYDMHRLVQIVTRLWLTQANNLRRIKSTVLKVISDHFPNGDSQSRFISISRAFLPHANTILQSFSCISEEEERAKSLLLQRIARYLSMVWRHSEAEVRLTQAIDIRKRLYGANHSETLIGMLDMGEIYISQGRTQEAEAIGEHVMKMSELKLGSDHPVTLKSMCCLIVIYAARGRLEEAKKLETQASKMTIGHISANDLQLIAAVNLAVTSQYQGRWEEAEKILVQVLETMRLRGGVDSLLAVPVMNQLAVVYGNQGRFEEAEKLGVITLGMTKLHFGADHPDALMAMENLAYVYAKQSRWEDATQLQIQFSEACKLNLGADHPDTIKAMGTLACFLRITELVG